MRDQKPWNIYQFEWFTFQYGVTRVYTLSKRQKIKDTALQNSFLGQSKKTLTYGLLEKINDPLQ